MPRNSIEGAGELTLCRPDVISSHFGKARGMVAPVRVKIALRAWAVNFPMGKMIQICLQRPGRVERSAAAAGVGGGGWLGLGLGLGAWLGLGSG